MDDRNFAADLFACPRCDRSPLDTIEGGYACAGCKIEFPDFAGMPWLFAEPRAAFEEWRGRWSFAFRSLQKGHDQIKQALASAEFRDTTRARLEHLYETQVDH